MPPGMYEMYVIKSRGFLLEEWREMSDEDKQTELLYAQMEYEHIEALRPRKEGDNGRH
jgi:hypothetical protein